MRLLLSTWLLVASVLAAAAQGVGPTTPPPVSVVGAVSATLAVTSSSARVAIPAGAASMSNVTLLNDGATEVWVALGGSSITASATTSIPIPAGQTIPVYAGTSTYVAAITASSTSTLRVIRANGAVAYTGGGGSGGGGGGSVTQGTVPWVVSADPNLLAAIQAAIPTQDASVSIGGVGIVPTALAAGGITPVVCGSAVSSCVLKAGAGNLYSAYAECTAACWLMVFNSTTAPPNGATTAGTASGNLVECIDISAASSKSLSFSGMPPEVYSVGITAAISSTACATLTLATTGFVKGSVK